MRSFNTDQSNEIPLKSYQEEPLIRNSLEPEKKADVYYQEVQESEGILDETGYERASECLSDEYYDEEIEYGDEDNQEILKDLKESSG